MEDLKQGLELLFKLQSYDIRIRDVNKQIDLAPSFVEEERKKLNIKKVESEEKQKQYVALVSLKKEKEFLLESKEEAIAKRSFELNSVKSNDTYSALLLEIERLKSECGALEDELLCLMEKINEELVGVKVLESQLQELEKDVSKNIANIEGNVNKLRNELVVLEKTREEHKLKVNKTMLSHYERLREGRDGIGVAVVDGKSCGGCGMVLRTQLINQAMKGHELVFCDNCSMILLKR